MNRFLTHTLPAALVDAQKRREDLERQKWRIGSELDEHERWFGHSCNCEHCDSQDYTPLTAEQVVELEKKFAELDEDIKMHDIEIKRMIAYKEWMEKRK